MSEGDALTRERWRASGVNAVVRRPADRDALRARLRLLARYWLATVQLP